MPRSHSVFNNLPEFWLHRFAGVELWQWGAVLLQVLVFLVTYAVVRLVSSRLLRYRPVGDTETAARKNRKQISRALGSTLGAAASGAVVMGSELTPWLEHPMTLLFRLAMLTGMMMLANALWDLVCDGIVYHSDSKKTAQLLVPITRKLVRFTIITVGGLVALGMVGVDIAGVVAGLGITGIVVALAAKDSVENVFGSITIMFDMPFTIGDWVKIGTVEGVVEEINLRSTRIRTFEDTVINLPNANLIRASVENFGLRRSRRQRIGLRFDYANPIERIAPFLDATRSYLESVPAVVPGKSIVALNEFADTNLSVFVQFLIEANSQAEELAVREQVMLKILDLAAAHRLAIGGSRIADREPSVSTAQDRPSTPDPGQADL